MNLIVMFKMNRIGLYVSSLVLVIFLCTGCSSTSLPPMLTQEELNFIETNKTINATVAVKEYKKPVYSQNLYETLKKTGIFTNVIYLVNAQSKEMTYIAEVNRRIHGTASILPLLTVISLGIIPTWLEEEYGISFILRNEVSQIYYVDVSWRGKTIIGWIGLFSGFLPDRTFSYENSERYHDRIKFQILQALIPKKSNHSNAQE